MSTPSDTRKPEDLLLQADFVRGLARSLVLDWNRSEDLTQEILLAAITKGTVEVVHLQRWFKGVSRHLAYHLFRTERRRAELEARVARRNRVPSTAEVVEREETRKKVVEAVLDLEEPYRSPVLLRYYENLPLRKIAAELGISINTAKGRLKRGLELLRQRLDKAYGGDRAAWCAALLPIAGVHGLWTAGSALSGGTSLWMKGKFLLLVATVTAAILLPLWFFPSPNRVAPKDKPGMDSPGLLSLTPEDRTPGSAAVTEVSAGPKKERLSPQGRRLRSPAALEIHGRVVHADGAPGADVQVHAMRVDDGTGLIDPDKVRSFQTRCDGEGNFAFRDLPPGAYSVGARYDGKAGHAFRLLGPGSDDCEIVLYPARVLKGRVTITGGGSGKDRPVEAWVSAFSPRSVRVPCSIMHTDAEGRFELDPLEYGWVDLIVTAEGRVPARLERVDTARDDLVIPLASGPYIEGTVYGPGGAGIEVSTVLDWENQIFTHLRTRPDPNGHYRLGPFPAGVSRECTVHPLVVTGTPGTAYRRTRRPSRSPDVLYEVDFNPVPYASISGRVSVKKSQRPVAGMPLLVFNGEALRGQGALIPCAQAVTDSSGRFLVPSLDPGEYVILAGPADGFDATTWKNGRPLRLGPGEKRKGIELHLTKEIPLEIRLSDPEGRPLAGAHLSVEQAGASRLPQALFRNGFMHRVHPGSAPGVYEIHGLPEGSYRITTRLYGRENRTIRVTLHEGKEPVTAVLQPAFPFSGRVVGLRGKPVPGATISFARGGSTFTDEKGAFLLPCMQSGDGAVTVEAPGYCSLHRPLHFQPGMPPMEFTLFPEGKGVIEGRVHDPEGNPLAGVRLRFTQERYDAGAVGPSMRLEKAALSGPNGRFRIDGLLEDRPVESRVLPPEGYLPTGTPREVTPGGDLLDIVLVRAARVVGRVKWTGKDPFPAFRVHLKRPDGHDLPTGREMYFDGGRFDLETQPGVVRIFARTRGGSVSEPMTLALEPGKTAETILKLPPPSGLSGYVRDALTSAPLPGTVVFALKKPGFSFSRYGQPEVTTGPEGAFSFQDLEAGSWFLEVHAATYAPLLKGPFHVEKDRVLEGILLRVNQGATLTGRVHAEGRGIGGAKIQVSRIAPRGYEAFTGPDGRFRIDHLPADTGTVGIVSACWEPDARTRVILKRPFTLGQTSGATPLELSFGSFRMEGRVFAPEGGPGKHMTIRASKLPPLDRASVDKGGPSEAFELTVETRTQPDGSYRLPGLLPGSYRILVYDPMHAVDTAPLEEIVTIETPRVTRDFSLDFQ